MHTIEFEATLSPYGRHAIEAEYSSVDREEYLNCAGYTYVTQGPIVNDVAILRCVPLENELTTNIDEIEGLAYEETVSLILAERGL